MLPIAGQRTEPIVLTFFVDTQVVCTPFLNIKTKGDSFFSNMIILI